MRQPGGQTLTLPTGTYTMSDPDGITHDDMLWLAAEAPGSVVVTSPVGGANFAGVGFAGITFGRALNIATATTVVPTARVVFWYCELTNPDVYHSSTYNTPLTLFHEVRGPVYVMGCDVHDTQHDGIKANPTSPGSVHIQGCRIWDVHGYPGIDYHCDAVQVEKGVVVVHDTVTGLTPDQQPSGSGHVMIDNRLGSAGTDVDLQRLWVTNSSNYGIHLDRKNAATPLVAYLRDVSMWDNAFLGLYVAGGPTIDQGGVTDGISTGTAPDEAWRQQNPYQSLPQWAATVGL